jgi:DNA-binding CsgD family transcriptional regulator
MRIRTTWPDAEVAQWGAELAFRARAAADAGQFCREVLAICRKIVGYDSAVLTEQRGSEPQATVDVSEGGLALMRQCEGNLARYAPDLRKFFAAVRRTRGMVDVELYSSRERRELALFREIVKPQGVSSTLALTPHFGGVMLGMIRLERHGKGSPFTSRDLQRALALLPIIELGLLVHHRGCHSSNPELERLSAREAEVARHVARGLTNRQIGLLLGTSPFTVRNQVVRIFDRLRVCTRAELAARLATRGADVPFRSRAPRS